MLGAAAGSLVLVLGRGGTRRRRLQLAAVTLAALALVVGLSRIPSPLSAPPARAGKPAANSANYRRTLFTSSGRLGAWRGALRQAEARPVAGYGFGTEQLVFVNRYSGFDSDLPENSYIGLLLQLGVAGLALLAALVGWALAGFARRPGGPLAAALAGTVVAALVIGLTESYLLSAGNIATLTVWVSLFLLVAQAPRGSPRARRPAPSPDSRAGNAPGS